MARVLHPAVLSLSLPQAALAAVAALCLAAFFLMCASHSRAWRVWYGSYDDEDDYDPVIQHNSGAAVLAVEGGEETAEGLWQKNILMGGKCKLPDFSGVIIYDSRGNAVNPHRHPLPPLMNSYR